MAATVDAVPSDEKLPERTQVVVIGAGIIGVSTALALAEKGIPVVLCEKGQVAAEQSSRNWGWCRTSQRDPREIALSVEAQRMWEGMDARIGESTGFTRSGILFPCETDAEVEAKERWLEHARPYQLDSRMLSAAEMAPLLPGNTHKFKAGLYTASDGRAEPQIAAPAMARAARRLGATVLTNCAVRGVETAGGRVSAVVTEKGRIACSGVVLAGGAWSRLFSGNMGIDLPQLMVTGSVLRTMPIAGGPECAVGTNEYGIRKRADGGYTMAKRNTNITDITPDSFRLFFDFLPAFKQNRKFLKLRLGQRFFDELRRPRRWSLDSVTPFEQVRIMDPAPSLPALAALKAIVARDFPVFRDMQVAATWGGLIDSTPDVVPVISTVDRVPGFVIATGFSGHGFGIGPAAGRLAADLVTGDRPIVDPREFRFSRYTDGSNPRPKA
ncbi:glycine/D-amino acid oxidase-like deaminating enzyme [Stella humosa]|uniref:Glycine/D-amino acid oxidase-like deaminating enzyme n=1 Tax=Stella humosa TaxID=94 RepID=A0A3N1LLS8_9PROT|nr:FAD-binding oxidoreductase [Stella humosa]ROP91376.1 glycine/D-amino acid oxidase-like deaminating enzyme [Stella humosa]BBK34264.1 D-amino-acid oxidase [Stella humosa]